MKTFFMIVLVMIAAFAMMKIADSKNDCEDSGGHYVRGFYGFECVR